MPSYQTQRTLAVAVAVLLAGIAVVQVADPADFGMTPVMVRWLGVIGAMLGVAAGFLPSVRGMSRNPDFLANRVSELPEHDRQQVVHDVQERAGGPPPAAIDARALSDTDLERIAEIVIRKRTEGVTRLREVSGRG